MDPIQVFLVAGGAGIGLYVLKQFADEKYHTNSEVIGLRQDKADLLKVIADGNARWQETITLLRECLECLDEN